MAECSESIGRSQASGLAYGSRRVRGRSPRRERARQRHHEVAAGDQRLLVGRGHDLAGPQRREHRPEADDTARPDHDQVDVVAGREGLERVGPAHAVRAGRQVQAGQRGLVTERDGGRPEPGGLFGQERPVRPGRQRDDPERVGVPGQHVDGLSADRPGRADQGDPTGRGRGAGRHLS